MRINEPPEVWTATGLERPVFVDLSGRRARLMRAAGVLVAALALGGPVTLVAGASGFASLPALPAAAGLTAQASPATHRPRADALVGQVGAVQAPPSLVSEGHQPSAESVADRVERHRHRAPRSRV
jgi:hypothetical protein